MQKLELDEKNHVVIWQIEEEKMETSKLSFQMLEHNNIDGILSFCHYFLNKDICFQYDYGSLQPISEYLKRKEMDYDEIFFLCSEILLIIERGEEYLLYENGYLIAAEWIFWNRYEKKLSICYLPGRDEDCKLSWKKLVEDIMKCTNHKDKKAVGLIYGLYDMILSDGVVWETQLAFIKDYESNNEKALKNDLEVAKSHKEELKNDYEVAKSHKEELKNDIEVAKSHKEELKNDYEVARLHKDAIKNNLKTNNASKKSKCNGKKEKGELEESMHQKMQKETHKYFLEYVKKDRKDKIRNVVLLAENKGNYALQTEETRIGRDKNCDIQIPFLIINEQHAKMWFEENEWFLMDIGSCNGTYLNGEKITAYVKTKCQLNDVITFADISYRLIIYT